MVVCFVCGLQRYRYGFLVAFFIGIGGSACAEAGEYSFEGFEKDEYVQ